MWISPFIVLSITMVVPLTSRVSGERVMRVVISLSLLLQAQHKLVVNKIDSKQKNPLNLPVRVAIETTG